MSTREFAFSIEFTILAIVEFNRANFMLVFCGAQACAWVVLDGTSFKSFEVRPIGFYQYRVFNCFTGIYRAHKHLLIMKTLLETLNYQPHSLTESGIEHPESAIADFFTDHELHEARAKLQEFYHAWQYYHADAADGDQMKDMVFFFNNLIDLVNAGYVVNYRHEQEESQVGIE